MTVPGYVGWIAAAAATYGALCWMAGKAAFFPMRHSQGWWESQTELGAEDVWLTTSDGVKLHGWWLSSPYAQIATLFLHGNAGNLTHRGAHMRAIVAAGSSILVLDYRGYGKSGGTPSERGLYRDAEAAYEWLGSRGYSGDRIVLHGESLGSAPAVELAARKKCAGLVLEAPFPSVRAVAGKVLPILGPLITWGYNSAERIASVRVPKLFIHGDKDEVIAYDLGKALFDVAPEPKTLWTVHNAGHNNLLEFCGTLYIERLREFYGGISARP
jgi:fermentation-respiration switch protein FrsA (DUF1100 family)